MAPIAIKDIAALRYESSFSIDLKLLFLNRNNQRIKAPGYLKISTNIVSKIISIIFISVFDSSIFQLLF